MTPLRRVGDQANHWVWHKPIPWLQVGVLALAAIAAVMFGLMS